MDSIDKEHIWDGGTGFLSSRPARVERSRLRGPVGFLLLLALVFAAAIAGSCGQARAAEAPKPPAVVVKPEGPSRVYRTLSSPAMVPMVLRLYTQAPCVHPKLVEIITRLGGKGLLPVFKAADLMWEGRHYAGCWLEDQTGRARTIFEDGTDLPPVPMRFFRDESV